MNLTEPTVRCSAEQDIFMLAPPNAFNVSQRRASSERDRKRERGLLQN